MNLTGASVGGGLAMSGSLKGGVDMKVLQVKPELFMGHGATFNGDVNLIGASVGGWLAMGGSTFKGDVNLIVASVGGGLAMSHSTFKGVNMERIQVKSDLFIGNGATFRRREPA